MDFKFSHEPVDGPNDGHGDVPPADTGEGFQVAPESAEPTIISADTTSALGHVAQEFALPHDGDAVAAAETFEQMMAGEFDDAADEAAGETKEPPVSEATSRAVFEVAEHLATRNGPRIPDTIRIPEDPDEPMLPLPPMWGQTLAWRPTVTDANTGEQQFGGRETQETITIRYEPLPPKGAGEAAGVRVSRKVAEGDAVTWYTVNRTADGGYTMEQHSHIERPEPPPNWPDESDPGYHDAVMASFKELSDRVAADRATRQLAREMGKAGVSEAAALELLDKLGQARGLYDSW